MFSVIIPLYNKEISINRTVQSVLDQTFKDFEIIIVNDGSTDKSRNIIERFDDSRIRIIDKSNGGVSSARNRGITEANHQWIALLDGDDIWMQDKLESVEKRIRQFPDIKWLFSSYVIELNNKSRIMKYKSCELIKDSIDVIARDFPIHTSTVVIKADIFSDDRFLFNESFSRSEDRELWYKLACSFPFAGYINKPLSIYFNNLPGSLTYDAIKSKDFSFMTLNSRLKEIYMQTDKNRVERMTFFVNLNNFVRVLNYWALFTKSDYEQSPIHQYLNRYINYVLVHLSPIPIFLKKSLYWGFIIPMYRLYIRCRFVINSCEAEDTIASF